jgi:hypothetical protein
VLFNSGLRVEEAPGYLGVAQPLYYVLEDLHLTSGEAAKVRQLFFGYQLPEQLPRRDEFAFRGHRDGANQLIRRHSGLGEA